ncbi:MAG TPA: hypothetical protein VK425_03445 [Acidimicrobiales bacterium]|nr:hypothetical protein [Acidimicrobiales bacterium]
MTQDRDEDSVFDEVPREQRPGLTREEDDELRRLGFMARYGSLTAESQGRLDQLRLRDRRKKIRLPRLGEPDPVTPEAVRRVVPRSQRPADGSEGAASGEGPGTAEP